MTDKEAKKGRPTIYSTDLVATICERIASGESVRSIVKDEDMPVMSTFFRWLHEKEDFKEQYNIAKQLGADAMFADIIGIADDGTNDYMEVMDREGGIGGWKANGEVIQRSRLRVDTRKWYLSKVLPKIYGERQQIDTTHSFSDMNDDELNLRIKKLEDEFKGKD
jgi:hypothetical protein